MVYSVYGLVDIFPKLLDLPKWLHWWEKPVIPYRERQEKIWMRYWNQMRAKIEAGQAPECFGRSFVETGYQKKGIDEMQAAFVAGSMLTCSSFRPLEAIQTFDTNLLCEVQEIHN